MSGKLPPSFNLAHRPNVNVVNAITTLNSLGNENSIVLSNSYTIYSNEQTLAGTNKSYAIGIFHSLSYRIVKGTGTLSIDGVVTNLENGDNGLLSYPILNTQAIILTATTGDISILINK
jgi:hypothetical protein